MIDRWQVAAWLPSKQFTGGGEEWHRFDRLMSTARNNEESHPGIQFLTTLATGRGK